MKKYQKTITSFITELKDSQIYVYASAAAFYLFLSLIPMILVACSVVAALPFLQETDLIREVSSIPGSIPAFLTSLIAGVEEHPVSIISISAVTAIWSAGKGMQALTTGINAMNRGRDERSFFAQRLRACAYMVLFMFLMLALLALKVFTRQLVAVINVYLPASLRLAEQRLNIHDWIPFLVLLVLFTAMYAYLPKERKRFLKQIPGGIFSALTWMIFTEGFTVYVEIFDGFASYGTLSTIVGMMLWLYFCCYLLLVGVLLNRFLDVEVIWHKGKKIWLDKRAAYRERRDTAEK